MKKLFCLILALMMTLSLSAVAWGEEEISAPNVAKIGDTEYASIQAAVKAAQSGDTVTVIRDHEMDCSITDNNSSGYPALVNIAEKEVTIDLNGKEITVKPTASQLNGKMLLGVFAVDTNGSLTLKDSGSTGKVAVTANDANVYSLAVCYGTGGKMTINSGSYSLDYSTNGLIYAQHNEVVTINGGTFHMGNVGTLSNGSPWIFCAKGQNTQHVIVTGGTFNADINHQYYPFEVDVPKERALKNNGDGTWTMVDAVAYVNEPEWSSAWYIHQVGYASIKDAVAGADSNKDKALDTQEYHRDKNINNNYKIEFDSKGNVIVTNAQDKGSTKADTYKIFNLIDPVTLTVRDNGVAATVVELNAITPTIPASVQYGYSTDGNFPEHNSTVWQDSTLFTGLTASTAYTFFARYVDKDDPSAAFVVSETTATTAAAPTNVFVGGDAAGDAPEQVTPVDGTITLPENTFHKDGFVFDGWSDGTNTYQPGDTYTMPEGEDVVFTPLWKEVEEEVEEEEESTTPPTPPAPPYYGGNITEEDEELPEEKPAETKPVEDPVTPPTEEEVVTPEPEDTTPVVPDEPVVDEPVVDEPVVDEPPVDDDAPQQGSAALWVGIGAAVVAAGACAIVFIRKRS